MAPRKKVTVQYRKLDDLTGSFGAMTLQDALSAALKKPSGASTFGDDPKSREFKDEGYGSLVLNTFEDVKPFFFGETVRFEPGADLPLLQIGTGAKAYNLTQSKAPAGHEPIRGMLYFMAIGNHVLLLEADFSAARAERYLGWLLAEQTSTVAQGSHVILTPEITAAGGSIQLSQVEQIVVKPRPISSVYETLPDVTTQSARKDVAQTNTLEVLKAAGMDDADIHRLAAEDMQLEVVLQIKFKGQRRKRQLGIDETNRLLRNLPEDELTLIGPGGRQKNGRIEKLSYVANVETVGSFLAPKDVARALHEGFAHFVSNGYIDG